MLEILKNVSGLAGGGLSAYGAWVTAKAVMLSEDQAIWIGLPRISGSDRERQLQHPNVQNLLASSRAAKTGLKWVALGVALQTVPSFIGLMQELVAR
ncbi:hypothetical protein GC209_04410 [bacterium]|nr:hypothetical protein [bacterium]